MRVPDRWVCVIECCDCGVPHGVPVLRRTVGSAEAAREALELALPAAYDVGVLTLGTALDLEVFSSDELRHLGVEPAETV